MGRRIPIKTAKDIAGGKGTAAEDGNGEPVNRRIGETRNE